MFPERSRRVPKRSWSASSTPTGVLETSRLSSWASRERSSSSLESSLQAPDWPEPLKIHFSKVLARLWVLLGLPGFPDFFWVRFLRPYLSSRVVSSENTNYFCFVVGSLSVLLAFDQVLVVVVCPLWTCEERPCNKISTCSLFVIQTIKTTRKNPKLSEHSCKRAF